MIEKDKLKTWKGVVTLAASLPLVDMGVLLNGKEARVLSRELPVEEIAELIRHIAIRFCERTEYRLPEEILVETLMHILVNHQTEEMFNHFLEELLLHPNHKAACFVFTELAIGLEVTESADYNQDIFAIAVAIACELGLAINQIRSSHPGEIDGADQIISHLSTYLLSVSNSSDQCIRLSLVRYFGIIERGRSNKPGFNRIMERFGHTVLERLFSQLFDRKTEGVALQFLMSNLPFVLEGDNHTQNILHETLKFYMLKQPARFSLFINSLSDHLLNIEKNESEVSVTCFLKHLGILVRLASDLNHRELGRELITAIGCFSEFSYYQALIESLRVYPDLRSHFAELLSRLAPSQDSPRLLDDIRHKVKRGRRPSFTKQGDMKPLDQVTFLGHRHISKAS